MTEQGVDTNDTCSIYDFACKSGQNLVSCTEINPRTLDMAILSTSIVSIYLHVFITKLCYPEPQYGTDSWFIVDSILNIVHPTYTHLCPAGYRWNYTIPEPGHSVDRSKEALQNTH